MLPSKAVILYGNGGDLGNLEVFAKGIRKNLPGMYGHNDLIVKNVIHKDQFFAFIETFAKNYVGSITELHIVSHAIGAGLFLGYHVAAISDFRWSVQVEIQEKKKRRINYDEVVATEIGAVLTDDFLRPSIKGKATAMRGAFAAGATIKIWGCNSGVTGWLYGDNGEADPNVRDERIPYYWRALNTCNVPKPSIAQAFANFFQRVTYGATSGAHVEVLHRGKWIKSEKYRSEVNSWPSPRLVHRLQPDRGEYKKFTPGPLP